MMKKSITKLLALLCTMTTALSFLSGCLGTGVNPPEEPETPPVEEPAPDDGADDDGGVDPEPEPVANVLLTDFETPFNRTSFTTYNYVNSYTDVPREDGDAAKVDYGEIKETVDKKHVFTLSSAHGWEGPYWLNGGIDLPFSTNTFSFSAYKLLTEADIVETGGSVLYLLYNDEEGNRQEKPLTIDYENKVDISETKGADWYQYTATLPDGLTTKNVRCFEFKVYFKGYSIDNIYAINTAMEQLEYEAPSGEVICDFETDFQYVEDGYSADSIEYSNYGYFDPNTFVVRSSPYKWYTYEMEQGNRNIKLRSGNGWEGFTYGYPGFELMNRTNRFKVRAKGLPEADFWVEAYYYTSQGEKVRAESVTLFASKPLTNGWTEYTFITNQEALRLVCFCFKTYSSYSYNVDDIYAVYLNY